MFLYKYYLEIKNRCFLLFLSWVCLLISCYFYKEVFLIIMVKSTRNFGFYSSTTLYFICTDVKELFNVYFELIFFVANQLGFVLLVYHLFMFFYLGLSLIEYLKLKSVLKVILTSFLVAIVVSYLFIIPLSWQFFLAFQHKTNDLNSVPFFFEAKISEYFNFVSQMYSICFLSFQIIGFLFLFLNNIFVKIKFLEIKFLRKIFYFFFIIFSTIITPPDLISQIGLSLFLILFFEFFVFKKLWVYFNEALVR